MNGLAVISLMIGCIGLGSVIDAWVSKNLEPQEACVLLSMNAITIVVSLMLIY